MFTTHLSAGLYSDSCEIQAPQMQFTSCVLDCQAHFQHLITHMHHVNPTEHWHKALFFLFRLKEQVVLPVGRGMNVLYVPKHQQEWTFFKISPQILQMSTASFADFLILNVLCTFKFDGW